jgi:hypothetical protein
MSVGIGKDMLDVSRCEDHFMVFAEEIFFSMSRTKWMLGDVSGNNWRMCQC